MTTAPFDTAPESATKGPDDTRRKGPFAPHHIGWIIFALVVSAAGAALWWFFRDNAPVSYVTARVNKGTVAPYVTASGSVNPVVTIQVGTYVSGVIQELPCDFNTRVHKGQLCAKIDPRPYQTVVDQDEADLTSAHAQLQKDQTNVELATITYERNKELLALDSVSKEAYDTANSTYKQALSQVAVDKAAITQRQAALRAAQVNLGYTNIVSPVDGTVVSRNVTQGQTVAASFQTPTLFVIAADLTQMQVDASVSESDIGEVGVGNNASFTVEAFPNRIFNGRVVQVRQAPQTVQNVVTYDVVINVANADLALKPGMTAATRITTFRHENVLRVPLQALRYSPVTAIGNSGDREPSRVWLLGDGAPVPVPLTTGLKDDSYAEVLSGKLKVGDRIVVTEHSSAEAHTSQAPGQMPPRAPRL